MRFLFLILFLSASSINVRSQTDAEKAYKLAADAVKNMDEGNTEKAIDMLNKAISLDPDNMVYPYEQAYAYYRQKEYKKSISLLKKLKTHEGVNDRVYQMLGNCHDLNGEPNKAIEIYDIGLEKFPSSGPLYMERGNMELKAKSYNTALDYYEKGIEVDPNYPSNYYWAAKIYLSSSQEVWGMTYGELFMNLERNSDRTAEISRLLFDTYKSEIDVSSDTTKSVSFSNLNVTSIEQSEDTANFKLPFGTIYETAISAAIATETKISLASLNRIRKKFIDFYYRQEYDKKYANPLFSYHKKLIDKEYFTLYNYFILMKGDREGFETWLINNGAKWKEFLVWYHKNPIELSSENYFYRDMY